MSKEIQPKSVSATVTVDGVTHLVIELTEEQIAYIRSGSGSPHYSIRRDAEVAEKIVYRVGEGFVIEEHEEES